MGGFKMHGKVVWPGFSHSPAPRHVARVGRNEPCPCGSRRKYKDCHEKDGESFLVKLARAEDKRRYEEMKALRDDTAMPWYRRLFRRGR